VKTPRDRSAPTDVAEILAGPHAILEALRAGRRRVRRILLARQDVAGVTEAVLELARARGLPVEVRSRAELDRLVPGGVHQGIAADAAPFPYMSQEEIVAHSRHANAPGFLVVLDGVQDPQNLGGIIRTVDAAGAQGLILPRDRAASVTPAAVRASAGATEHVSIARVTNVAAFLAWVKEEGFWVIGADANTGRDLYTVDLTIPLALVIGGEERGLRPLVKRRCDVSVRIPLRGMVASLNASAAAAICLFEVVRQRKAEEKRLGLTEIRERE
jgi:23S rRNA (guanosine2251-2'-O)-methyltransferase